MLNGLKLGAGVATGATKGPENETDVKERLDKTQPVSGDNDVAEQDPAAVAVDPPTPAEERKDTLREQLTESVTKDATTADDGVVRYSSHPIVRYKLGRFQFENGLIELRNETDVSEFRALFDQLPMSERLRIKELDISAAEAQVRTVREHSAHASKKIGSDSGNREPAKQVGKGELGDSNQ